MSYPSDNVSVTQVFDDLTTSSRSVSAKNVLKFEADDSNISTANCMILHRKWDNPPSQTDMIYVTNTPAAVLALFTGGEFITLTTTSDQGSRTIYVNAAHMSEPWDETSHRAFYIDGAPGGYQLNVTESLSAIQTALAATTPGGTYVTTSTSQTGLSGQKDYAVGAVHTYGVTGNSVTGTGSAFSVNGAAQLSLTTTAGNVTLTPAGFIEAGALLQLSSLGTVTTGAANDQSAAFQLTGNYSRITTNAAEYGGVALPTNTGPGNFHVVTNDTANIAMVWPGVSSGAMNEGSGPVYLMPGQTEHFWSHVANQWRSEGYMSGKYSTVWDFSIDGGAIGDHTLFKLQDDCYITRAYIDVVTTLTSGTDAATGAIGIATDDVAGVVAAIAISDGTNPWDAGFKLTIQTGAANAFSNKTTAARDVQFSKAVEAITGGKMILHFEWARTT